MTTKKTERECMTCAAWHQRRANGYDGECRRRAPSRGYREEITEDYIAEWPRTTAREWCLEYESRKPA